MEIIRKLTYDSLVDLIYKADYRIFWVSPALTTEVVYSLCEASKKGVDVSVVTDIHPKRFKWFEGELKAIEILIEDASIKVRSIDDLGLGFIIIDNQGFAFFNPMRAYEADGERYNAFVLDTKTISSLVELFFEQRQDDDYSAPSEQPAIKDIESKDLDNTKMELKKDPPVKPDIQRLINVYRSHFQFVDVGFPGSKLPIKKVKLPKRALPFKDAYLNNIIESQLRLFSDITEKEFFKPFFDLIEDWDNLREKYTTHIQSRKKNVIKKSDRPAFEKDFSLLLKKVDDVKINMKQDLQEEIYRTISSIRDNMKEFFIQNPTKDFSNLSKDSRETGADLEANKIIGQINFPKSENLLSQLSLVKYYYDITWEDLNDENVITEFKEKGLIDNKSADELRLLIEAYEIG